MMAEHTHIFRGSISTDTQAMFCECGAMLSSLSVLPRRPDLEDEIARLRARAEAAEAKLAEAERGHSAFMARFGALEERWWYIEARIGSENHRGEPVRLALMALVAAEAREKALAARVEAKVKEWESIEHPAIRSFFQSCAKELRAALATEGQP